MSHLSRNEEAKRQLFLLSQKIFLDSDKELELSSSSELETFPSPFPTENFLNLPWLGS